MPTTEPSSRRPAEAPPSLPVLVVAGAIVAGAVGVFLLIAEDVLDGGGLLSRDATVLHWFVDHRTAAWMNTARLIGSVCGFVGLSVAAIAVGLLLWRTGHAAWLAAAPLVALSLASLASTVAKQIFDRPRPPAGLRAAHTSTAAFPSGHATSAAACFLAIGLVVAIAVARRPWVRVVVVALGAACAGVVGLSRLVLAVHWLSDVVAGWALGTAAAVVVVIAAWWLATRDRTPTVAPGF